MLCEYGCNQEAKYQLKNGKWCCSEHTSQCPAIKEKNSNGLKKCYQENRKDCSHLDGIRGQFSKNKSIMSCNKIFHKHSIEEIFCINSNVCKSRIKELIIKEKILEYKCDICGNMGEWNNQKIILHVDHINGVNNDNRLENLRFLCPNCHSQTKTYCRAKNSRKLLDRIDKEKLVECLKNNKSVVKAVCEYNRCNETSFVIGNTIYRLANELIKEYGIIRNNSDIKDSYNIAYKKAVIINELIDSDIDFTKFGWVKKASLIIGITPQKTRKWLSTNYPKLIENSYIRD